MKFKSIRLSKNYNPKQILTSVRILPSMAPPGAMIPPMNRTSSSVSPYLGRYVSCLKYHVIFDVLFDVSCSVHNLCLLLRRS